MAIVSPYLSEVDIKKIYASVNLDTLDDVTIQEDVDQATGEMESRLNKRFKIPLLAKGNLPLLNAPVFTQNKIKLTFKTSLRNILAQEYMRNSDLNNLGEYGEIQSKTLSAHIKDLLDYKNDFGLELKPYAHDAVEPVQHVGIAKANNNMSLDYDE